MPQLILVRQGQDHRQTIPCRGTDMIIGRLPTNDVVLDHESVSRQHAKIECDGARYFLVDLGSNNGTLLNHALVQHHERYLLRPGDVISVNGFSIHFTLGDELEQSLNEVTDSDIVEVKLLKKVLSALDRETHPSLEVLSGVAEGRRFVLTFDPGVVTIGRDPDCDWSIEEYVISRRHARIERRGEQIILHDLQSKNGTFVNNEPVTGECAIRDGDRLAFGTVVGLFRNPSDIDVEAVKAHVASNAPQSRALVPTALPAQKTEDDDFDLDDLTGTESAPGLDDSAFDEAAAAHHYPAPAPRLGFIDRFSIGEAGLLWAGIVVLIATVVMLVKLFA